MLHSAAAKAEPALPAGLPRCRPAQPLLTRLALSATPNLQALHHPFIYFPSFFAIKVRQGCRLLFYTQQEQQQQRP